MSGSTRLGVHRRHRAPALDYRRRDCRRVFNTDSGTALQGTNRRPSVLVLIPRGVAQGVPIAQLACELDCNRMELLGLRHQIQENAVRHLDPTPLPDPVTEANECCVNAGGKRGPAS